MKHLVSEKPYFGARILCDVLERLTGIHQDCLHILQLVELLK